MPAISRHWWACAHPLWLHGRKVCRSHLCGQVPLTVSSTCRSYHWKRNLKVRQAAKAIWEAIWSVLEIRTLALVGIPFALFVIDFRLSCPSPRPIAFARRMEWSVLQSWLRPVRLISDGLTVRCRLLWPFVREE